MSSIHVRPFRRSDHDQLTALVNAHVRAVVPGLSVSVNTVLGRLEREPDEVVVDPWVVERSTLVAEQDGAVVAVAEGFWVSHVPWEGFADFWGCVERSLVPGGRVLFVDDAHRTADELIEGPASSTIRRRLRDGTAHRAVKVPHTPESLQRSLTELGWAIEVHGTRGPFYWGFGGRALGPARPADGEPGSAVG